MVLFCVTGAACTSVERESRAAAPESNRFATRMIMMSLALCYVAEGCASAGTKQDRPVEALVESRCENVKCRRRKTYIYQRPKRPTWKVKVRLRSSRDRGQVREVNSTRPLSTTRQAQRGRSDRRMQQRLTRGECDSPKEEEALQEIRHLRDSRVHIFAHQTAQRIAPWRANVAPMLVLVACVADKAFSMLVL
jgi:hypothetical protein